MSSTEITMHSSIVCVLKIVGPNIIQQCSVFFWQVLRGMDDDSFIVSDLAYKKLFEDKTFEHCIAFAQLRLIILTRIT